MAPGRYYYCPTCGSKENLPVHDLVSSLNTNIGQVPTRRTGSVGSDWQKIDTDMLTAISDIESKDFATEDATVK